MKKKSRDWQTKANSIKYVSYFLITIHMSGGHDDHDDHGKKSGGSSMNIGITSMIGSFFGVASGAGPIKDAIKGWGGGGGHDHH